MEELTEAPDLREVPLLNALRKAEWVADRHPGELVLGADTMIWHRGRIIGKPADLEDAARILGELSGEAHEVITGLALVCRNRKIRDAWLESSRVFFKKLTPAAIREYLELVPVLDKAGAYAIQEHGDRLIEHFEGEFENTIGLPLIQLKRKLSDYRE